VGHILSFETLLHVAARDRSAAEFGVRAYQQDGWTGATHGVFREIQLFAGWTVAWKER